VGCPLDPNQARGSARQKGSRLPCPPGRGGRCAGHGVLPRAPAGRASQRHSHQRRPTAAKCHSSVTTRQGCPPCRAASPAAEHLYMRSTGGQWGAKRNGAAEIQSARRGHERPHRRY
jgi:hypothetical protein